MIYIRADANELIGTGHVMRCLSIAEKIRSSGEEAYFITADKRSVQMIESKGFEVICLDSVWDNLESETDKLIKIISSKKIEILLIDTYYVTFDYLSEIKKHTKTAYIDDLHKFAYPVDLLINYNIYADKIDYSDIYGGKNMPKLALGCEYVPLRKEFCGVEKHINRTVENILITTGGTDNYNVTGSLIEDFKTKKWFFDIDFYFVLGRFNKNIDTLKNAYGKYENTHFLVNIPDMDKYMKMCDIAVTAGGTTTYELCACGIPSVMYTLADNQLEIAKTVSDKKIIPWAGDVRDNPQKCADKINSHIETLCGNYSLRCEVSKKMQDICDGHGCERIVKLLIELLNER